MLYFRIKFCIWCKVRIQTDSSACGYFIFLAPFAENSFHIPGSLLLNFNIWWQSYDHRYTVHFWVLSLFHWSIRLSSGQWCVVWLLLLCSKAKNQAVCLLTLFTPSNIVLAISCNSKWILGSAFQFLQQRLIAIL